MASLQFWAKEKSDIQNSQRSPLLCPLRLCCSLKKALAKIPQCVGEARQRHRSLHPLCSLRLEWLVKKSVGEGECVSKSCHPKASLWQYN